MAMPEATVNEDDGLIFRQNNVGLPWEVFGMKSVTVTMMPECLTYKLFRLYVFGPNMRHAVMPLLGRHYIRHIFILPKDPDYVHGQFQV